MGMEGIWKMVVDSSAIIIVGTIFAAVIAGLFGMGRVQEKVEKAKEVLGKDHEGLEKTILDKTGSLEKSVTEKTLNIYSKVDEISTIMNVNKGRYENLNLDQREVKNNVSKLVFEWEKSVSENKELETRVRELELEIIKLKEKYKHKELER